MVLPLGDLEKTRIVPFVTYALIALNVVMYLVQLDQGDDVHDRPTPRPLRDHPQRRHRRPSGRHAARRREPARPARPGRARRQVIDQAPAPFPIWLTLFTSMFLHGSPLHLAGNMLYLWIFGDNVEEVLGTVRYLLVYLACGLIGTLAQIAANPDSLIPTLGASGAIAGVMGAYVVWFPHNQVRVLVFRFITEMPALAGHRRSGSLLQVWLGRRLDRPARRGRAASPTSPTSAARRPASSSPSCSATGPGSSRR